MRGSRYKTLLHITHRQKTWPELQADTCSIQRSPFTEAGVQPTHSPWAAPLALERLLC